VRAQTRSPELASVSRPPRSAEKAQENWKVDQARKEENSRVGLCPLHVKPYSEKEHRRAEHERSEHEEKTRHSHIGDCEPDRDQRQNVEDDRLKGDLAGPVEDGQHSEPAPFVVLSVEPRERQKVRDLPDKQRRAEILPMSVGRRATPIIGGIASQKHRPTYRAGCAVSAVEKNVDQNVRAA
jgi:hypothetical protein